MASSGVLAPRRSGLSSSSQPGPSLTVETERRYYVLLPTLQGARLHCAAHLKMVGQLRPVTGIAIFEAVEAEEVTSIVLNLGRPGVRREEIGCFAADHKLLPGGLFGHSGEGSGEAQ